MARPDNPGQISVLLVYILTALPFLRLNSEMIRVFQHWRSTVVLLSAFLSVGLIAAAFWQQDWRYSLPTPRPSDLRQPEIGERLRMSSAGVSIRGRGPLFLHFFNPDCPCSRFNLDHIRSLIQKNKGKVRFVAVLQGEGGAQHLTEAFQKLGLGIESVVDEDGAVGRLTGVYSTPQAVLIDGSERLYFRGNYNSSRYCTSVESEYARIALESMLAGKASKAVDPGAAISYGCPLPRKNRNL